MRSLFFCLLSPKLVLWQIDYKTYCNLVRVYNLDVYAAYCRVSMVNVSKLVVTTRLAFKTAEWS